MSGVCSFLFWRERERRRQFSPTHPPTQPHSGTHDRCVHHAMKEEEEKEERVWARRCASSSSPSWWALA